MKEARVSVKQPSSPELRYPKTTCFRGSVPPKDLEHPLKRRLPRDHGRLSTKLSCPRTTKKHAIKESSFD